MNKNKFTAKFILFVFIIYQIFENNYLYQANFFTGYIIINSYEKNE